MMIWRHVEDADGAKDSHPGFSIWRCGHCRALAVCTRNQRPDGRCQKCHLP